MRTPLSKAFGPAAWTALAGAALLVCAGPADAQSPVAQQRGAAAAQGAPGQNKPGKPLKKPPPDQDDPRGAEQPDLGPPVPSPRASDLQQAMRNPNNHGHEHGPFKAAPDAFPTRPQQPLTRVKTEQDKRGEQASPPGRGNSGG